jgi:hypothetical protein
MSEQGAEVVQYRIDIEYFRLFCNRLALLCNRPPVKNSLLNTNVPGQQAIIINKRGPESLIMQKYGVFWVV